MSPALIFYYLGGRKHASTEKSNLHYCAGTWRSGRVRHARFHPSRLRNRHLSSCRWLATADSRLLCEGPVSDILERSVTQRV